MYSNAAIKLCVVISTLLICLDGQSAAANPNDVAGCNGTTDSKSKAAISMLFNKYQRLGIAAFKQGQLEIATHMFEQAVQEAQLLNYCEPCQISVLDLLSAAYAEAGKLDEALKMERKALDLRSGSNASANEKLETLLRMVSLYRDSGDRASAEACLTRAVELVNSRTVIGDSQKQALRDLRIEFAMSAGDFLAAKKLIAEELDSDKLSGSYNPKHFEQNALILWQDGQVEESEASMEQSLKLRANDASFERMALLRNLCRAKLFLGKTDEAKTLLGLVLPFDRAHLIPNNPDYLFDLLSLADLKLREAQLQSCQLLCAELTESYAAAKDSVDRMEQAELFSLKSRLAAAQQNWTEAAALANQAMLLRDRLGLSVSLSVSDLETLSNCQLAQDKLAEARENLKKSIEIRHRSLGHEKVALQRDESLLQEVDFILKTGSGADQLSQQVSSKDK